MSLENHTQEASFNPEVTRNVFESLVKKDTPPDVKEQIYMEYLALNDDTRHEISSSMVQAKNESTYEAQRYERVISTLTKLNASPLLNHERFVDTYPFLEGVRLNELMELPPGQAELALIGMRQMALIGEVTHRLDQFSDAFEPYTGNPVTKEMLADATSVLLTELMQPFEEIASEAKMSPRTFEKYLAEAQVSYSSLGAFTGTIANIYIRNTETNPQNREVIGFIRSALTGEINLSSRREHGSTIATGKLNKMVTITTTWSAPAETFGRSDARIELSAYPNSQFYLIAPGDNFDYQKTAAEAYALGLDGNKIAAQLEAHGKDIVATPRDCIVAVAALGIKPRANR